MKKYFNLIGLVALVFFFVPGVSLAATTNKFDGRFLLQTQAGGQLWYVSPGDHLRHKIKSGENFFMSLAPAFQMIDAVDLKKIPLAKYIPTYVSGDTAVLDTDKDGIADAVELQLGTDPNKADTDGDGFSDKTEILSGYDPLGTGKIVPNKKLLSVYSGRLVVDPSTSNWYVNPADGRRYLLSFDLPGYKPERVIKEIAGLALGISNADLNKISVVTAIKSSEKGKIIDCGEDFSCMAKAAASCLPARIKYHMTLLNVSSDNTEEISKAPNGVCGAKMTATNDTIFSPKDAGAADAINKQAAAEQLASVKKYSGVLCSAANDVLVKKYQNMAVGDFSVGYSTDPTNANSLICPAAKAVSAPPAAQINKIVISNLNVTTVPIGELDKYVGTPLVFDVINVGLAKEICEVSSYLDGSGAKVIDDHALCSSYYSKENNKYSSPVYFSNLKTVLTGSYENRNGKNYLENEGFDHLVRTFYLKDANNVESNRLSFTITK